MDVASDILDADSRSLYPVDVDAYVETQRARLLAAFNSLEPGGINQSVGSASGLDDMLVSIPVAARATFGCARLKGFKRQGLVVTAADGEATRLWARADYRRYRRAAEAALQLLGLPGDVFSDYDVDHLVAKKSVQPHHYVELCLVPSSVNSRWGSHLEKLEARRRAAPGYRSKPMRQITYGRIAKVLGVPPPPVTPFGSRGWCEALAHDLAAAGVSAFVDGDVEAHARALVPGIESWVDATIVLGGTVR